MTAHEGRGVRFKHETQLYLYDESSQTIIVSSYYYLTYKNYWKINIAYWSRTQFLLSFQREESVLRSPEPEKGMKKWLCLVCGFETDFFIPQNVFFKSE